MTWGSTYLSSFGSLFHKESQYMIVVLIFMSYVEYMNHLDQNLKIYLIYLSHQKIHNGGMIGGAHFQFIFLTFLSPDHSLPIEWSKFMQPVFNRYSYNFLRHSCALLVALHFYFLSHWFFFYKHPLYRFPILFLTMLYKAFYVENFFL